MIKCVSLSYSYHEVLNLRKWWIHCCVKKTNFSCNSYVYSQIVSIIHYSIGEYEMFNQNVIWRKYWLFHVRMLHLKKVHNCAWILNLCVQVDLVICGLFICEFECLQLEIEHFSGTYPRIPQFTVFLGICFFALLIFWSLFIAYNEVNLDIQVSLG